MTEPAYTPEQIAAAALRYRADCDRLYADGYAGDFGTGLDWVMQTYAPEVWSKYFEDAS